MRHLKLLPVIVMLGLFTAADSYAQSGWWAPKTQAVRGDDGERPRVIIGDRDRGDSTRGRRGRSGDVRGRRGGDEEVRGRGQDRGGRSGDVRGRERQDRDDDVRTRRRRDDEDDGWFEDDDKYEDRRSRRGEKTGGPKFCRNGQGHPVHGMAWCREKGFGEYDRYDSARDRIEDVIFQSPRRTSRRGRLENESIGDILGDVILGRLQQHSQQLGGSSRLEGRWVPRSEERVLQIRSGSLPVAEFKDTDGDRRIDAVWLNE